MNAPDAVTLGRDAFERHAWATAYMHLLAAETEHPLPAPVLEQLAISAYLSGHDAESLDIWTRSHHAHIREGEARAAFQSAFWLGLLFLLQNEASRGNGWLARARRLIADQETEGVEHGYLLFTEAFQRLWSGDPASARPIFARALAIANQFREPDLMAFTRLGLGDSLVQLGNVSEGMALLDEVLADVSSGELSTLAVGIVYCAVIECFQHTFDVRRAQEWTATFSQWCQSQTELVPFRGECLVYRVEIMRLQGRWPLALQEITLASESFTDDHFLPWAGEAYYQQAELHRLRGEFDKAEENYRQANQQGFGLVAGIALMRLAQGREEAAIATLSRMLAETSDALSRARVLPAHVEVMLATGDLQAAAPSVAELTSLAESRGIPFLLAMAGQASGSLMLARNDAAGALPPLRGALACWHDLNNPYEIARTRVLIGLACRALGDGDSAAIEFDAARETFSRLGARPDLERLQELTSTPDAAGLSGLTERELEVLRLVAAGHSNRVIAEQLVVSEHTVRRHLQNIFAKLGVSSRAGATAYAFQHSLV